MARVAIGGDGRLILPKEVRERHALREGEELVLEAMGEGLTLSLARPDVHRAYVELTTRCNLDCAMCVRHVWRDTPGEMTWETFQAVVKGLQPLPNLQHIILGGYGEPLCHPRFTEMLAQIATLGASVTLTTNGLLLDNSMAEAVLDARLGTLVISLDAGHVQAYERAHLARGIEQVVDNLHTLRDLARKREMLPPSVQLEFVATHSNQAWLSRLPRLARDLGAAKVLISNLLPHIPEMTSETLYDREKPVLSSTGWPVAIGDWVAWGGARLPRTKWGAARRCRFVEEKATVIGWDGGVSPCYALMHAYPYYIYGRRKEVSRYVLGNVREQPLVRIWASDEYVTFRAKVRDMRFPSCVDCGAACDYAGNNEDCWGNVPSCADCLWAQDIVRCP